MKITIPIEPKTKKNSQQIIVVKGRPYIIPSKAYKEYEKACAPYLSNIVDTPIIDRVNVEAHFYMQTRRLVDLTNLNEAIHDVLVKYGVLADDNMNIIVSTDGSRVHCDKEHPRTEVIIERIGKNES